MHSADILESLLWPWSGNPLR